MNSAGGRAVRWLALFCSARVAFATMFTAYSAVLPLLKHDWQMTAWQAGLIQSAYHLGFLVSLFCAGFLSDRHGARRIYLASSLAAVLSTLLFAFLANGFWSGLLLYGLTGLCAGGSYTPGLALIAQQQQGQRQGQAMGFYLAAASLGYALGLLIASVMIPLGGWRASFLVTAAGPLLGLLLGYLALRGVPNVIHRTPGGHSVFGRFGEVIGNRAAMLSIWGYTFHAWELLGLWAWLPTFLGAAALASGSGWLQAASYAATLTAITYLVAAGGSIIGGTLADRHGRTLVTLLMGVSSLICSFSFGWMVGLPMWLLLLVATIYNFTGVADSSIHSTTLAELVEPSCLGTAYALRSALGFGAGALAPWVFGLALDAGRSSGTIAETTVWALAWATLGLGGLLGPWAIWRLRQRPEARRLAGFELHGGFSRYSIVDWRVLDGDDGSYLVPLRPDDGYAEVALCEPWACVEASYAVTYRTAWKPGGVVLLTGDGAGAELGRAVAWRPRLVVLAVRDQAFAEEVRTWAERGDIAVQEGDDGETRYDDIVVLGGDEYVAGDLFSRLAINGSFNIVLCGGRTQAISIEARRLHYDHLLVTGTGGSDLSAAYTPVRTQLKAGGAACILGAGGPMGQMHLLCALSLPGQPRKVVATNLHAIRMEPVRRQHQHLAAAHGVALACLSADQFADDADFAACLREECGGAGYDDIVVVAPATEALEQAVAAAGDNCVINVFAGTPPGAYAHVDLNAVALRGVRFTGTSGSSIADLRRLRDLVESRQLDTNRSVAAIGGLEGVPDGLHAVAGGRFAGKVVIFPNLNKPLPLTPLSDLGKVLPTVAAQLAEDGSWTRAAEEELLKVML